MKLQRFTAANNQLAMLKVHNHFGPEALIYSTRKSGNEVEILAGLPGTQEEKSSDASSISLLTNQIRSIEKNIKQLSNKINQDYFEENERNHLYYYLGKLGFRGKFRQQFVDQFIMQNDLRDGIDELTIEKKLTSCIMTDEYEMIETQNICALLGPTGVGKTTTIIKLAKRYLTKYNAESIGLITTDYHDITAKNQLIYYSELFGIDLEYANSADELSESIERFHNKSFILIDTNGVSQRNEKKINALLAMQEKNEGLISCYLTLPCNIQEPILDEIARAFTPFNISGCIITKTDESISMAPAVNVCLNNNLNLSYICNGQNINTDIMPANAGEIMYDIMSVNNSNMNRNIRRVADLLNEPTLERY